MMKRDLEIYENTRFRYVIIDEAQNIKNPGTQNAKAVKKLQAEVRLALTGTPIENSLSELWSIFDFALPGYLFNSSRFTKTYESPIMKDKSETAAGRLRKQIAPFILRRLKADVLTELPEKVETTLYADMTNEQKLVYDAYLLKTKGELEETLKLGKVNERQIEILSMLTRLRQICCHPNTFLENYAGGSGKLDLTIETVKSSLESGHRVLIFSQFTKMLAILTEQMDAAGIKYYYLDGATPSKERLEMTEAFNGGQRDAFLISLKAGGSGLNLTGADIVIHYDPWWNPAVMTQAADRAHRFGQTKMVQVFNIVAKDSIEEKIISLQNMKKDMVDSVISEGGSMINALTEDEIRELFYM
jgi:SNF2 family DNA or RNA helicase